MAPRHDFAGTGVPAPDGYTASTDAMSSSGSAIAVAAEDARTDIDDLQPTPLSEADFGTATEHFATQAPPERRSTPADPRPLLRPQVLDDEEDFSNQSTWMTDR